MTSGTSKKQEPEREEKLKNAGAELSGKLQALTRKLIEARNELNRLMANRQKFLEEREKDEQSRVDSLLSVQRQIIQESNNLGEQMENATKEAALLTDSLIGATEAFEDRTDAFERSMRERLNEVTQKLNEASIREREMREAANALKEARERIEKQKVKLEKKLPFYISTGRRIDDTTPKDN